MYFTITAYFSFKQVKKLGITTEEIKEKDVLFVYDELMKTGRFTDIEITDEEGQLYTPKMIKKMLTNSDTITQAKVYIDGAFDKGTKGGGEGIVIYYKKGNKWFRYRESSPLQFVENNNDAEYLTFEKSLQILEEQHITCRYISYFTDSKNLVEVFEGNWPVYDQKELKLWSRIDELIKRLKVKIVMEHIPRKENTEAHKLSQQGLEGKEYVSHIEVENYDE